MRRDVASNIRIVVQAGDALRFEADVLALKYANELYGVDRAVFKELSKVINGLEDQLPEMNQSYITQTKGTIGAQHVLFIGVGPLRFFGYEDIRAFSRNVLEVLAAQAHQIRHIALTLHGPGYGLDENEAFESEIAGLLDAIASGTYPEQVTIVELNTNRAQRLAALLEQLLPGGPGTARGRIAPSPAEIPGRLRSVGYNSQSKPHIFVAMPFAEDMDDVFHYGIYGAVSAAGFLCERADLSTFTGDVIDWVKRRIASASLVIADLSTANPNVYLEVGYAWGCGRPTVLVIRDTSELKFDTRSQRCLVYKKIKDLETTLRAELSSLAKDGTLAMSIEGRPIHR